jgi:CheY-like chemotaxis protein
MVKESPRGGIRVHDSVPSPDQREAPALGHAGQLRLAHDLNNPLAIISTNLDFVLGELDAGRAGEDLRAAILEARDAAARIASVVGQTLSLHPPDEPDETRAASVAGATFAPRDPGSGQLPPLARILVVDDEKSLGVAIRRSLRDYNVVVTESGPEALARLANGERFDVIFCDLMMPGMTGMDVHAEILRVAPDQAERMVFLTGGAITTRARDFVATVPNPVIDKPFEVKLLREMIRMHVVDPEE